MSEQDIEQIKAEIKAKKIKDRKILRNLAWFAITCVGIGYFIETLPGNIGGLLIDILYIPLLMLILAIPFYIFEWGLDLIKKDK